MLSNKGAALELFSQTVNGSTAKTKSCQWKIGQREQKAYTWHFTSTHIANPMCQNLQVVNLNVMDVDDAPCPKKPCRTGIKKTSTTSAAFMQPRPTISDDRGGVVAYEPQDILA